MTVGGLIHNLILFADYYERASADIDREEGVMKPWFISHRDADADVMQRDFRATVAIDRVRAYVLSKYGADLTIGTARELLGDLIRTCSLSVDTAEALTLQAAMDRLDTAHSGTDQGKAGSSPPAADSLPETDAPPAEPAWTPADTLSRWAKLFGFSADTLKRRFKDGSIRYKKLSTKSYQIAVDDLPAMHQPKFRNVPKAPAK
jgi:hypothetical protein